MDSKVVISAIISATFLISLAMILTVFISSPRCPDISTQLPGAGSIKIACAQTPPTTSIGPVIPGPPGPQGPPGPPGPEGPPGPGPEGTPPSETLPIPPVTNKAVPPPETNVTQGLPVPDFPGTWNVTGSTKGIPLSATMKFKEDNTYEISGAITNPPNQLFNASGIYKFDKERNILSLASNTGTNSTYYLTNIQNNSFFAYNPNTNEFYSYLKAK